MQEIIDLKEYEAKIHNLSKDRIELKSQLEADLERRRITLQDIWIDRLNGNPRDIDTW